jgi:hypothetical protein
MSRLRSADSANQYNGKAGATPIAKHRMKSPPSLPVLLDTE